MIDVMVRVAAALLTSLFACIATAKTVGIMQQTGYQNAAFWRWLKRKDNLFFNRLSVLALCLALSTAILSLCFSFLGTEWALLLSALPYFGFLTVFWWADKKYALKVRTVRTGRAKRLFGVYYVCTALFAYVLISLLAFLSVLNGSELYALVAFVPFALLPLTLPVWLCVANAVDGAFENARNRKFVERAGQVLDERKILRVAVVGSYGKTSVKNILKALLSRRYLVVETPASYNTPVGLAKTVFSPDFEGKELLIAEMGARKAGDIEELCKLVKPDYAVFTGVCPQHIATFGSLEEVLKEKSYILQSGAKAVVCGASLAGQVEGENVRFAPLPCNLRLGKTTAFTLSLGKTEIEVETSLIGRSAAENIALAASLCWEMGLSVEEIKAGLAELTPVPHRLELTESNGVYILDDGYNCNIRGAHAAIEALSAFEGRRCVVTPGIVEGGILEEELNAELGRALAKANFDSVILVGETLVGAVKAGYLEGAGAEERLQTAHTLTAAQEVLVEWLQAGDTVLFLNDLPDAF